MMNMGIPPLHASRREEADVPALAQHRSFQRRSLSDAATTVGRARRRPTSIEAPCDLADRTIDHADRIASRALRRVAADLPSSQDRR
jgi:hypothetical protein